MLELFLNLIPFLPRQRSVTLARRLIPVLCLSVAMARPAVCIAQSKPAAANFEAISKQASEARDAERLDEALKLYKQALALRPKWPEGWWSIGTIEYDRNNFQAAANALQRLLPLAPHDGTAHVMLGLAEFELGDDANSLKHITEGRALGLANDPQLRQVVLFHEGLLELRSSKFKTAQTTFTTLCLDGSPDPKILQNLGSSVLRLPANDAPQSDQGREVVLRAGEAACLAGQKKYEEARGKFIALAAGYPDFPNIHYAAGRFLIEVNDVPAAVDQFQQEIKNNPDSVISRLEIAAAKYKLDSAAGIPYAEDAVRLNPNLPFAHYLLGLLYLDTDAYLKAIPELEIAQKAFPKEPKIYFALGSAYSRAGRNADAEKARATFLRLNQAPSEVSKPSY